jgi:hypothetical protein
MESQAQAGRTVDFLWRVVLETMGRWAGGESAALCSISVNGVSRGLDRSGEISSNAQGGLHDHRGP